ncbi:MAG TPA: hypothetical protein VFR86_26745 [Burkholderiaceae bacterium]|nr:hypothetical protein [Burkholderiaceae bacterium]
MCSFATQKIAPALVVAVLVGGAGLAAAQTTDKTAGGIVYATGAVTVEELRALESEKGKYNLWVTTAAKGSGAHLSDAAIKITNPKEKDVVVETTIVGPWFFINLPPGTYQVETTFQGQTQKRTARVAAKGLRQMILYFDEQAEVSPDWESPFEKSPYAQE